MLLPSIIQEKVDYYFVSSKIIASHEKKPIRCNRYGFFPTSFRKKVRNIDMVQIARGIGYHLIARCAF